MKQLTFIFVLFTGLTYGQSVKICDVYDYVHKNEKGFPLIYDILYERIDTLTSDFENEKTFLLRYYCFIEPVFTDTILNLKTDSIYISGNQSIELTNWENDFKNKLRDVINEFKPYILIDSLKNSNCKTLLFHSKLRRCR